MNDVGVEFVINGAVGEIHLNRPKALNALTLPMVDAIHHQMRLWEHDDAIAVLTIEGTGEKAFCAGGDIRGLYDARMQNKPELLDAFYRREYQLNHYMSVYPKPCIALLDGITMGGGVGVSVHGRYRVVTEKTMFAMPETGIGFFPDVGGGYFLPRCPGETGIYLGLTGARLAAADCLYTGIATHGALSADIPEIKNALATADFHADGTGYEIVCQRVDKILANYSHEHGKADLENVRAEIDAVFSAETLIDVFRNLEGNGSEFSVKVLKMLISKSPMALAVTFKQIREGAKLDLAEDLKMEFRLSQRMVEKPDLFEGVRAVIVDKDHAPRWAQGDVGQVDPRDVDAFFAPLPVTKELAI
ncbi:enoyl-CoA hydratase/isomerase family protein [Thalassospira sp. TSL5-1]|uniref:enoyl-CoA hydratase/isomerase family protein n=1 Tax=Thalassospira sp. TSL5-1 TaxID=1544451 RepID=UPI0009401927|nr:enoyl-CoA hydratase/isomerase family protein [Thalassospira sp. TSL5-1]OKH89991.1 enoyl-CoA hydratase [Thalassospira sp. TSL5-1]